MNDETIVKVLGVVVSLIAIIAPVLKLNQSVVRLTVTLENLEARFNQSQAKLEDRVGNHGKQIDNLEKTAINHDLRIKAVEKEVGKNE